MAAARCVVLQGAYTAALAACRIRQQTVLRFVLAAGCSREAALSFPSVPYKVAKPKNYHIIGLFVAPRPQVLLYRAGRVDESLALLSEASAAVMGPGAEAAANGAGVGVGDGSHLDLSPLQKVTLGYNLARLQEAGGQLKEAAAVYKVRALGRGSADQGSGLSSCRWVVTGLARGVGWRAAGLKEAAAVCNVGWGAVA